MYMAIFYVHNGRVGRFIGSVSGAIFIAVIASSIFVAKGVSANDQAASSKQVQVLTASPQDASKNRDPDQVGHGANGTLIKSSELSDLITAMSRYFVDDNVLERLGVEDTGMIQLAGSSGNTSSLLGALKESAFILNPALQGEIQIDRRTRQERFNLVARLPKTPEGDLPSANSMSPDAAFDGFDDLAARVTLVINARCAIITQMPIQSSQIETYYYGIDKVRMECPADLALLSFILHELEIGSGTSLGRKFILFKKMGYLNTGTSTGVDHYSVSFTVHGNLRHPVTQP